MKAKITDLQDLECKELVLKITGEVQSSNLPEFESAALKIIDNINLKLKTDADFEEAKKNVKSCKAIVIRIHNDRESALKSTKSIDDLITVSERLEKKFDATRIILEKAIKTESAREKKEIVDAGIKELERIVAGSPVQHGFDIAEDEIRDAIKNKRSYDKMRDAVREVVLVEKDCLKIMEELFEYNDHYISKSLKSFPGLYPDAKELALKPTNEVELTITAREEKFKNDKREADERKEEKRVADEKAKKEAERKVREDEKEKERKEHPKVECERLTAKKAYVGRVESDFIPPPLPDEPHEVPLPPRPKSVAVTVMVDRDIYDEVLRAITRIVGVVEVLL